MSLREQLLASGASGQGPSPYPQTTGPHHEHSAYPPATTSHQGHEHPYHHPPPSNSSHDHQLDPNVTGNQMAYTMSDDAQGEDGLSPDARNKGKRELSTSKRAAQNRAAQRAFRQRKEGYIKKLEEQVKEFQTMEINQKALQSENYQLREYILNLQSRLLESQSDIPPAPAHISLSGTGPTTQHSGADAYGPEQQLRRELAAPSGPDSGRQPGPPPPAQVMAGDDSRHHDGLNQLQAAAASHAIDNRGPPQGAPQYGLAPEYKRGRGDDAGVGNGDAKAGS